MAAAIGVTAALTEAFAPATGYIQEVSADDSVDPIKIKDENGVTKRLVPKKMTTKNVTISGEGTVTLATAVTAGAIAVNTAKTLSVKQGESAEGVPTFEANLVVYSNLS